MLFIYPSHYHQIKFYLASKWSWIYYDKFPPRHISRCDTGLRLTRNIRTAIKMNALSHLPLKRLFAMAPHGAMGSPSLVRYGSHSLLGFCKKAVNVILMMQRLLKFLQLVITLWSTSPALYRQCRPVTIQLAVIPGLHITSVVLIEVG